MWSPPSYFLDYSDHLFFEWMWDGLFRTHTSREILKGYEDEALLEYVKIIF